MIKQLIERVLLRKGSTSSGQFTLENIGEFKISAEERRDHFDSPVVGKSRLNEQQRKLEEVFQLVPKGVVVEWGITDGVIEFLVKEKPVNFSDQQVQDLIAKMNTIALDSEVSSK
ncbi:hypothetical protein [Vibrio anguillarum]|uniref:Uncharacterized protein n=1 Tax=Vibrio anguillarum TaxID=55601 RepID=A0ABR9Z7G8_VIBAN|nr:hypothetical protein [Vibrio anguillarum]MBF4374388.1 hypothetical protein [Vibrio anguillarum]